MSFRRLFLGCLSFTCFTSCSLAPTSSPFFGPSPGWGAPWQRGLELGGILDATSETVPMGAAPGGHLSLADISVSETLLSAGETTTSVATGSPSPVAVEAQFRDPDEVEFPGESSSRRDRASADAGPARESPKRRIQFSGSFNFVGFPTSDFKLENNRETWDDSWRYELTAFGHYPLTGHVEPLVGAYFFFEDREWREGSSLVDDRVLGFGAELGAMLYPVTKADERAVNVAVMPFGRLGVGFNDGVFQNVPVANGFSSGNPGNLRFEASVGAEARLLILRRVFVGIGVGFTYWTTFDASGVIRDGTGVIIIRDADLDYTGTDVFARLTIGVAF